MTAKHDEFERVAMPHSRSLLRVARRITSSSSAAEDLVQDTLLRAWRSFHQFQTGTNARAWLFRIMFNAFHAQGRKIRSAPILVPLGHPDGEMEPPNPSSLAWSDAAAVMQALDGLSEEHRSVLVLGVVEGFTCREMADILSVPIGTVMSRLSRARQALRERLAPVEVEAPARERARAACAEREAS
ncbi:MAG TPA: sigma-70 family RNA polymerase sigma factor [Terracidiphilus sp.]|nr:sigma-70 family RNA polymerase sigma factor [Terracidiphilus sp.]